MKFGKARWIGLALSVAMVATLAVGCNKPAEKPAEQPGEAPATPPANTEKEDVSKYPSRTIEVISQFGAGGGTDIFIRGIGVDASKVLKQSVVPISVTGGGGIAAYDRFISQPADGYSIYAIGPEQVILHNWGQMDINKDLAPVIRCQSDTSFLYAKKGSEFKTIDDVVTYAKANPGKLTVAITNAASYDEVLVSSWAKAAGIEVKLVPYASGSEAIAAVLGGHVQILHEEIGPAKSLLDSGDVIPLVVFNDKRIAEYDQVKDVPTSVEKGWDVTIGRWRGFAVKAGTDPAIIDKLYNAFAKAMEGSVYKAMEKENMLDIRPGLMNAADFTAFIQSEIESYKTTMDAIGMKPQS